MNVHAQLCVWVTNLSWNSLRLGMPNILSFRITSMFTFCAKSHLVCSDLDLIFTESWKGLGWLRDHPVHSQPWAGTAPSPSNLALTARAETSLVFLGSLTLLTGKNSIDSLMNWANTNSLGSFHDFFLLAQEVSCWFAGPQGCTSCRSCPRRSCTLLSGEALPWWTAPSPRGCLLPSSR